MPTMLIALYAPSHDRKHVTCLISTILLSKRLEFIGRDHKNNQTHQIEPFFNQPLRQNNEQITQPK